MAVEERLCGLTRASALTQEQVLVPGAVSPGGAALPELGEDARSPPPSAGGQFKQAAPAPQPLGPKEHTDQFAQAHVQLTRGPFLPTEYAWGKPA
jgi:hypothetical protein